LHAAQRAGRRSCPLRTPRSVPAASCLAQDCHRYCASVSAFVLGRQQETLTPLYGAAYYTEVGETKRQALNEWIRTGKAYDAVIDFDRVTRDPENPKMFLPIYDSCDHLHPNDAGYRAMADAIDLSLFKQ